MFPCRQQIDKIRRSILNNPQSVGCEVGEYPSKLIRVELVSISYLLPVAAIEQYFFGTTLFIISTFLILLILLQQGRGGGLTGALGGPGGQSAFGTKAGDIFTRITIVTAGIWIFLAAVCVYRFNEPEAGSALSGAEGGMRATSSSSDSSMGPIGEGDSAMGDSSAFPGGIPLDADGNPVLDLNQLMQAAGAKPQTEGAAADAPAPEAAQPASGTGEIEASDATDLPLTSEPASTETSVSPETPASNNGDEVTSPTTEK